MKFTFFDDPLTLLFREATEDVFNFRFAHARALFDGRTSLRSCLRSPRVPQHNVPFWRLWHLFADLEIKKDASVSPYELN